MTQSVAMIGLGKLGLPVAEAMAKHYTVYGYDINKDIKSDTVTICDKLYHAVHDVDIVFIAMPTPHDPEYGGEKPISKKIKKDQKSVLFDPQPPEKNFYFKESIT